MNLERLVRFLEAAGGPDHKLDILLGIQIGYERHPVLDAKEVEPLHMKWKRPNGELVSMPAFTESVDAAWEFALAFNDGANIIAVAVDEHGRGSAQVNEVKVFQLPNPALALCAAAMKARIVTS